MKDCALEELGEAIRTVVREKTYISLGLSDVMIKDFANAWGGESSSVPTLLTAREQEVLQLMADGKSTLQIAVTLSVSSKTVEAHRKQIMTKLDLRSVAELTKYAIRQGLTSLND